MNFLVQQRDRLRERGRPDGLHGAAIRRSHFAAPAGYGALHPQQVCNDAQKVSYSDIPVFYNT